MQAGGYSQVFLKEHGGEVLHRGKCSDTVVILDSVRFYNIIYA